MLDEGDVVFVPGVVQGDDVFGVKFEGAFFEVVISLQDGND